MARFESFARELRLAPKEVGAAAISRELARFARAELASAIQSGQASPVYERFVNGRLGAAEETVVPPGPILYEFSWWSTVIASALDELKRFSPVRSGRYRASFIVLVNGLLSADFDAIPASAEVIVTNVQPYTRRIAAGTTLGSAKGPFERARQLLQRRYFAGGEGFRFETRYLTLPSGIHPLVPYVLKGGQKREVATANRRSSAFRAGRKYLAGRKDRGAGQVLTYPSLVINQAH
ncbi:MAG: hypothetical protein Rhirs2KO_18430 [Rhizobiaceae bacterium]